MTWKLNDTKLILMIIDDNSSYAMVFDYSFSNDGKTLSMSDIEGTSMILNKKI